MAGLALVLSSVSGCGGGHPDPDSLLSGDPPVMWVSDLYEPVNDPDDHYDLALSFSSSAFQPDLVVLDDHLGRQTGDAPALRDLSDLLGQPMPHVTLSNDSMAHVQWLRSQPNHSVRIVSLGALTSIAELIRSEPLLMRAKTKEMFIVAGDAAVGAPVEYNVSQDKTAFLDVMVSGLPIYWVPAFDGGLWSAGTSSFTRTTDQELLQGVPQPLRCWFDRYIGSRYGDRNLWAASFLAGEPAGFDWIRSRVHFHPDGRRAPHGWLEADVHQLVVTDREGFESHTIQNTNKALASLDIPGDGRDLLPSASC